MNHCTSRIALLAVAILPVTQPGCSDRRTTGTQIHWPDAQVTIESYAAGRRVQSVIAPDNSEHLVTIQRIVQGKQGTWQTSRVTHAPAIIIRNGGLKLSFHHGTMIANDSTEAGQPRQFECVLSDDEFIEVREAVRKILEESAAPEPRN